MDWKLIVGSPLPVSRDLFLSSFFDINTVIMKRKIIRLWAEYEQDGSSHKFMEPLSPEETKILIEESLDRQEEGKDLPHNDRHCIQKNTGLRKEPLSKERMEQIEEIMKEIDRMYMDNPHMIIEEREFYSDDLFQ
jgi:hypothetical protein